MFFNFLKKNLFGLDISDYSIEALELEKKFGKISIGAYSRIELEKGIVENGKILNKTALKEKINELLSNAVPRRIKSELAIISLPESKTFIHFFEEGENITEKASKTIPWNPDEIYFDYKDNLYAAASKETVNEYLNIIKETGLKTLAVDIESGSLVRAFETRLAFGGATLICDIGARTTNLTVADERAIKFTAIISIAGNHFTKAISEKLNIFFDQAEQIKKDCGLDPQRRGGKIMLVLQGTLQGVLDKIRETSAFYEENSGRKIKKILLCGGSSFMPKLDSYIGLNSEIPTEIPDPWEGIDIEILFENEQFRQIIETKLHPVYFANVIGLAKRGLSDNPITYGINLMPKD